MPGLNLCVLSLTWISKSLITAESRGIFTFLWPSIKPRRNSESFPAENYNTNIGGETLIF